MPAILSRSATPRPVSAPLPTSARGAHPSRAGSVWAALILAVLLVGFAVRLGILVRGGGLLGSDSYDDGVYYAAADQLVHGRVPYRDFLLLQPPGVVLAIAPFAWLGALTSDPVGVAVARLAFIALGAVNCALVAVILRRYGAVAAAIGGLFAAVFFPLAYSEHSTLLEPVSTFAFLVALLFATRPAFAGRHAPLIAGIALGAASGVRIWYVVAIPVLAIALRGGRGRLLLGAAGALAAIYLPFFLLSPVDTTRDVLLDQLGRPRVHVSALDRIAAIVGAPTLPANPALPWLTTGTLGLVLLALVVVLAAVALRVPGTRSWVVLLAVGFVVLLASPSWFLRYAALTAPLLALITGVAVSHLTRRLPRTGRGAVALVVVAGVTALSLPGDTATYAKPEPLSLTAAVTAVRGCVTSDDPATLAALDVLSRDLARGCTVWADVTGYTYDSDAVRSHGHRVPRIRNTRWQHHLLGYLEGAQAFIQVRRDVDLSHASKAELARRPVLAREGRWILREGLGGPGSVRAG